MWATRGPVPPPQPADSMGSNRSSHPRCNTCHRPFLPFNLAPSILASALAERSRPYPVTGGVIKAWLALRMDEGKSYVYKGHAEIRRTRKYDE
ncbi:hypothetical protein GJ744_010213 [Endocarpon pusillum]|uniref:Uncharacterized protein n=1 Tax=Endocarpon pusillum TaxID=364733 RepID=A0A8H7AEJ8_9EURO|nr:hypothetical protein GJ744_010213 [Endocarpon pusillum]